MNARSVKRSNVLGGGMMAILACVSTARAVLPLEFISIRKASCEGQQEQIDALFRSQKQGHPEIVELRRKG